jgi:hypothetical protein
MRNASALFWMSVCLAMVVLGPGQAQATPRTPCGEALDWLIRTFAANDAGYSYVADRRGYAVVEQHNAHHRSLAESISDDQACEGAMKTWLEFFRSGHIGVRLNQEADPDEAKSEASLKDFYATFPRLDLSIEDFVAGAQALPPGGFQGVWQSGVYRVGITRDPETGEFIGFIVEADGVYWHPGQIKLRFKEHPQTGVLSGEFFMRDHSVQAIEPVRLLSDNILRAGFSTWQRVLPTSELSADEALYLESVNSNQPFFRVLSDHTAYLRIPSFAYEQKKHIDAVLREHGPKIDQTSNLIIDVRGNGGGSDASYAGLVPLIYTNPIRVVGADLLSTPLNNAKYAAILEDDGWSDEDKEWVRRIYDKLNAEPGGFVSVDQHPVSVQREEEVAANPKQVAILIDDGNASTTEQFILAARQSWKTKLFGVPTMGILDFSNVHQVQSPDGRFTLWYATSKSRRLPAFPVDDVGLQPDYHLDDDIPHHLWVSHVRAILEMN